MPWESRIVEANAGALTSNTSFYHLARTAIVVLIDYLPQIVLGACPVLLLHLRLL